VKGDGTIASSTTGMIYLYQGGRLDPITGQYNFEHRDYDPSDGRWDEQDGGYWDGMNSYQFVESNPCSNIDPTGMANRRRAPAPAAPPTMSISIENWSGFPKYGQCGSFSWNVFYNYPANHLDGFIIQHLKVTIEHTSENPPPSNAPAMCKEPQNFTLEYWEAWQVKSTYNEGSHVTDSFNFRGCGGCTKGSIEFDGEIGFYQIDKLPDDFKKNNPALDQETKAPVKDPQYNTWPGLLYATASDPTQELPASTIDFVPHYKKVSWDCSCATAHKPGEWDTKPERQVPE
jgi:RHS repeat-associated protein